MDTVVYQLVLVAVLVLLNAAFAGSEMALVSLRESQLQALERRSTSGRILAKLARDPNRFLATIQIGITLAGFLASATAAVALAEPLVPLLTPLLDGAAEPVAIIAVTLVLSYLTLVVGELAPKRIAMQRAQGWALVVARPLDLLARLSRPAVWILGVTTDLVVRLAGADPKAHRDEIGPDELRDLVSGHRGFTPEQREIIAGAVEITQRRLREVLVPRLHVFALRADTPISQACAALANSGHSRAPVVRGGLLDDVTGVVNLRDLVANSIGTAGDHARPPLLLPESLPVSEALRRFKAEREQLGLVVDERGSVDGIVTLEDLLEEIVGEIYDETDRDVLSVEEQPDGSRLLPGLFPVHDLVDIGVDLKERPSGDYATVAGMVIAVLGHIPTGPGEAVTLDGWTFEITQVERHAITQLRLTPAPADHDANDEPA